MSDDTDTTDDGPKAYAELERQAESLRAAVAEAQRRGWPSMTFEAAGMEKLAAFAEQAELAALEARVLRLRLYLLTLRGGSRN